MTKKINLNGQELKLTANDNVPTLRGDKIKSEVLKLPADSIVFLTFESV